MKVAQLRNLIYPQTHAKVVEAGFRKRQEGFALVAPSANAQGVFDAIR
jgi:hypothetical protein